MTAAVKNVMVRVIKRRMAKGETFEEIIAGYPRLTQAEVKELKKAVGV